MKAGRKKKDQVNAKGEWEPTPEQKLCIELDLKGTTHVEIARTLKITEQTIVAWFHHEKFLECREKERNLLFRRFAAHIDKSLIKASMEGNVAAMRAFYEKMGEINGEKEDAPSSIVINISHE